MTNSLLEIKDVTVKYKVPGGEIFAVDKVSLNVNTGEFVAVVGESGCGKTTLARAVLGLEPLAGGDILLKGEATKGVRPKQAKSIGMVWQDPFASLDPRWRVGKSALEAVNLCGGQVPLDSLLREVGFDPALANRYPHELSGGQRQRIAIARAIALRPPLIICDEPTAALDLSARAQILNLLKDIQAEFGCSFLYISHDLATVRFLADRIAVMYLGTIVEEGPSQQIFENPRHWYTASLLSSAPTIDNIGKLPDPPEGEIPDPRTRFEGCRFASRCPNVHDKCKRENPTKLITERDKLACFYPKDSRGTLAGSNR